MADFRNLTDTYTTFSADVVTRAHGLLEDAHKLSPEQAESLRLKQAPKWQLVSMRLRRTFHFEEISAARGFTHRVQALSLNRNQHPNIFVDFKSVQIELWTQGLNGLTENDFDLAELIDQAVDLP